MPIATPTDRANDSPDARAAAWCHGIRSGNADALAEFYRHWFDRSVAIVRGRTGRDENFALDVVQDAMIRVARSMPRLESECDVSRWMIRVLTTCAFDRIKCEAREAVRRSRRAGGIASPIPHPSSPAVNRDECPSAQSASDSIETLRRHLAELKPDQRAAISLRFWFGRSLAAIGRAFSTSEDAAHGKLRASIRVLRRGLEGEDES